MFFDIVGSIAGAILGMSGSNNTFYIFGALIPN